MARARSILTFGLLALSTALGSPSASAKQITTVFVIAMENHNWTQPANQITRGTQQIYQIRMRRSSIVS
jgi:hypothetical protein